MISLSPVSSTVFPKGSVTGCDSSLGGGPVDDFSFSIIQVHFDFCKLKFIILFPYLI